MAGTTADKLNKLKQTKTDFKTTMTDMGLDVTDELPFGEYPPLLLGIKTLKKIKVKFNFEYSNYQNPYGIYEVDESGSIKFVWGGAKSGSYTHTTYAGFPIMIPRGGSRVSVISGSLTDIGQANMIYRASSSSTYSFVTYIYVPGDTDVEVRLY